MFTTFPWRCRDSHGHHKYGNQIGGVGASKFIETELLQYWSHTMRVQSLVALQLLCLEHMCPRIENSKLTRFREVVNSDLNSAV